MMTSRLLPLSSALLAGLVAVAILAASPVAAAVISDDFNDNRRNDALWIPTGDGVGPRLSERQGRLEVAFPSNSAGGIFLGGYFTRLQFRSDLDVQVDYELPEWPQANGVRVGLTLIRVGGGAVASAERMSVGTREEDISPSDFYLVDLGIPEGHQPTDDLSGKLRITRVGTTVTGYYWDKTNEAWVPLGSATLTDADVQIQLHAWSHDAAFEDQEVTVAFDNFVVNGGQVVGRTPPDLTGQWTRLRQQTRGKGPNQRSTIRGQFDVANVGQTAAGFSALRFYLSADAEFGTGDVLLQHVNLGGLAPGQRQTVRLSVASERGTSARRKFVIAVLDAAGAVPEANEPDNVVARGPLR